jgi:hypothetical protein
MSFICVLILLFAGMLNHRPMMPHTRVKCFFFPVSGTEFPVKRSFFRAVI